jgi:hypothetical protein
MTDIEICQRDALYCFSTPTSGSPGEAASGGKPGPVTGTKAMTLEILHLTAQIQRWLNQRVAQHLAEQAERLGR